MTTADSLAADFEAQRGRLRSVAYRMLGSEGEADDAVQEAWFRLNREPTDSIQHLGHWLTTVVARICLDMLRSRTARREKPLADDAAAAIPNRDDGLQPDTEVRLADSVGVALLVVLETLAPPERIAFVLHDMFDVSFDEIAPIVGRSSTAARQLASRARRRVQGAAAVSDADRARRRQVVGAFLAASRDGDLAALLAVLAPDVVLHADQTAIDAAATRTAQGAPAPLLASELRGARAVADSFRGRARGARPALVDGVAGAAWAPGGTARAVFGFTFGPAAPGEPARIIAIDVIADPARLSELDVVLES